ncbi:MAG: ADP-glyceromanno-heptose 6-epimerase [Bacteroidetes bacterium]|nr:ADP-glyceromanno-heptose 6-epimerase [Bacteroidota bacterium]MCL5737986.1 ADP-glyceromanno-heptose 6-epimerase [Bacteroidota bacterium]
MIIVTGGAGFIGSAIVWRLNQLGKDDILVVDNLSTDEKWKNLVPLKFHDYMEKDEFIGHATNQRLAAKLRSDREPIEAIIHMGACSATTERDATYLIQNNFEYTKQLALVAVNEGARFIYASSAATYGDGSKGFDDDEKSIDQLRPLNMYGYSKQLFDQWALRHGMLDRIVGLKYFNVFGPNEYHKAEMRSVVLKAFEQIKSSGKMQLFKSYKKEYKDGEQVRDFVYVKDAVEMTLFFLENRNAGGLFNIGSGAANTWNKLASGIFGVLGKPLSIDYVEMPETIREKYQYYTCADVSKIRQAGYSKEMTPLEVAVKDYVQNYLVGGKRLGE